MRRLGQGAASEVRRLASPLLGGLDAAWQRMHWWIITMAVLYAASGITIVRSDEVAVVLRWGRLVGATPALQEHGPGLLFAFPRPIDQVVRVPVKHVFELSIPDLFIGPQDDDDSNAYMTLDPVRQGYALTGDQNIVQTFMVARYRIRDAAEWAFYGPTSDSVLRVEVVSAMKRSLGEMGVDRVLSDGRKSLVETAAKRAQAGLDQAHSGLELSSLELTDLAPPTALSGDFQAVQSAYIDAETKKKDAQTYRESTIPRAQGEVDAQTQAIRGAADNDLAIAKGEAAAFLALAREYRANPAVVRERLYRDAVEKAIGSAAGVQWVPPPVNGHYSGFRVTVGSTSAVSP
jgi:modulator of FtsH protease HflK